MRAVSPATHITGNMRNHRYYTTCTSY